MTRPPRAFPSGSVLHVVNRGNERRRLFDDPDEYDEFLWIFDRTQRRVPLDLFAYVLMPNHWHIVLRAAGPAVLSQFMHDLSGLHARIFRTRSRTSGFGHVYQGRYHATLIEDDIQYVATVRYVEANPVRARLVTDATEWKWSSLRERMDGVQRLVDGPVTISPTEGWVDFVNRAGQLPSPGASAR